MKYTIICWECRIPHTLETDAHTEAYAQGFVQESYWLKQPGGLYVCPVHRVLGDDDLEPIFTLWLDQETKLRAEAAVEKGRERKGISYKARQITTGERDAKAIQILIDKEQSHEY